jgi:hypothetical protein
MIREDKSHLSSLDLLAIEKRIARLDIYSLRIDREQYPEEQKANNARLANSLSREEWARHCDGVRKRTGQKIESLLDALSSRFMIYQYKDKSISYSKGEWDLFFWCNGNSNGRDYSYITLNLNDKRSLEQRKADTEKVLDYIKEIGFEGLDVAIQYTAEYDKDKVKMIALNYLVKMINKPIEMWGQEGRIKLVRDNCYGFFKKGARKNFYSLSYMDILALAIN